MFSEWPCQARRLRSLSGRPMSYITGEVEYRERWDVPPIEEHHEQTVHEHGQNFEVQEPVHAPIDPPAEIVVPPSR